MSLRELRIGCVKYLNAQPLIHGWNGAVEFDHPAVLCRRLAAGELDVALVSSFEFLREPVYTIVDDVAVAAEGPVESVFLVHEGELEHVREIALDPASQASVNLLRCLLAERHLHPGLVEPRPNELFVSAERAQLMIGDQALRFRQEHGSRFQYWDLAEQWKVATGLPFVFALWLIRPEIAAPAEIAERLRQRRDENLRHIDDVIAAHPEFAPEFCARYFGERLRFHFGEREKQGLLAFRALCEKHGILSRNHEPLRLA